MREPGATVTPEAVLLEADLAGLGSRMVALGVDLLVQFAFVLLVTFFGAAARLGEDAGLILVIVLSFLGIWGYPIAFEVVWSGRTPGKRAAGIRVVLDDGQPITTGAAIVRNLLRIVDMLPGLYAAGAISILVTRRQQRIGDLAAGTIVVHDDRDAAPRSLSLPENPARDRIARTLDTATLSRNDHAAVRAFILRRTDLPSDARHLLATNLMERLAPIVGVPPREVDPETYLEAVVQAVRDRGGADEPPPEGRPT